MPRLINNNIKSPVGTLNSRRTLNNNTMRREFVFPLIVGLILGGLVMIFWQFNTRLNAQMAAMSQLQQVTAQNSKTVNDIVAFINQATGANQAAQTPAANQPTTPSKK